LFKKANEIMNIALYGKSFSGDRAPFLRQLIDGLTHHGANLIIYQSYLQLIKNYVSLPSDVMLFTGHADIVDRADCLFSIGGDGTMLDTLPIVRNSGIPVMGINMGRLGFLSSVSKQEIDQAISNIFNNRYIIDKRSLICLEQPEGLFGELNYALNEFTVFRHDTTSLIVIQVFIDNMFVNSYWADGLIIATPTGSTAYSLSAGGPILTPASANFVITPIATHNLSVRPIVIPDNSLIKIRVVGRHTKYTISMDSRSVLIDQTIDLDIRKENFTMNIIQMEGKEFFGTIREKLLWGLDIRN
jgi:NAD+ kinase